MAKNEISGKRLAISKSNAQIVGIVGAASFVTVFCLVASNAVFNLNRYQSKVITEKEKAHKQLQINLKEYTNLARTYRAFNDSNPNVIGGTSTGGGDNDGDNSKIILDALPSSYDFPALASSLEKVLNDRHLKIGSISGTDDQVAQEGNDSSPSPQSVEIPFSFSVSDANYTSVQDLISTLERSIRPIQIDSVNISGGASNMAVTVNAHTYYQPARSLKITTKVVK